MDSLVAPDDRFISDSCPQSTIHRWTFQIPVLSARLLSSAFIRVVIVQGSARGTSLSATSSNKGFCVCIYARVCVEYTSVFRRNFSSQLYKQFDIQRWWYIFRFDCLTIEHYQGEQNDFCQIFYLHNFWEHVNCFRQYLSLLSFGSKYSDLYHWDYFYLCKIHVAINFFFESEQVSELSCAISKNTNYPNVSKNSIPKNIVR